MYNILYNSSKDITFMLLIIINDNTIGVYACNYHY